MKFKIEKCTNPWWWYNFDVGKVVEIDLNDCQFEQDLVDEHYRTFIWFRSYNDITGDVYSKNGILLEDINYYKIVRKQKLKQLCLNQEIK